MFSQSLPLLSRLRRAGHQSGAGHRPRSLAQRIGLIFTLRRHRRALSLLDDRMLEDVGISRHAAEAEAARPFWDAPDHWRR